MRRVLIDGNMLLISLLVSGARSYDFPVPYGGHFLFGAASSLSLVVYLIPRGPWLRHSSFVCWRVVQVSGRPLFSRPIDRSTILAPMCYIRDPAAALSRLKPAVIQAELEPGPDNISPDSETAQPLIAIPMRKSTFCLSQLAISICNVYSFALGDVVFR